MAGLQHNTEDCSGGETGSGKSTTANTILGGNEFVSKIAAHTVTKSCQRGSEVLKERDLFVVDTPGLFDTKETLKTTCEQISECVLFSYPRPHAIILVLRLGCYTEEEQKTVALIKTLFGEPAMNHMIVLFTRKDDLGDRTLPEFIAASEVNLQSIIRECGNHCCAFNNKQRADEAEKDAQKQELVELIEEMVQRNEGAHFSEAIYEDIGEKLQHQEEALRIIYDNQLQKETKLLEEQCAEGKILEQSMEKKKILLEKYNEKKRILGKKLEEIYLQML